MGKIKFLLVAPWLPSTILLGAGIAPATAVRMISGDSSASPSDGGVFRQVDDSSSLGLEEIVSSTANMLRRAPASSVDKDVPSDLTSDGMPPSSAVRNILLSMIMLIIVVVAASVTVRDLSTSVPDKPGRQCPLSSLLFKSSSRPVKCVPNVPEDCLADAPVDWDKILISSQYRCVFDPGMLPIGNLLALPPPTFKSRVDFPGAMEYLNFLREQLSNQRQYVSVSDRS